MTDDTTGTFIRRARRFSHGFHERYFGPSGHLAGHRKYYALGGAVAVLLGIVYVHRIIVGGVEFDAVVTRLAEARRGVVFVSRGHGDTLPQSADGAGIEMLQDLVGRRLVRQEILDGVGGYRLLSVRGVRDRSDQYLLEVECPSDSACQRLSDAERGNPKLVPSTARPTNPLILMFDL